MEVTEWYQHQREQRGSHLFGRVEGDDFPGPFGQVGDAEPEQVEDERGGGGHPVKKTNGRGYRVRVWEVGEKAKATENH